MVCDLAVATAANILVLNESTVPIRETLRALRSNVDRRFFVPRSNSEARFHLFSRNAALDLTEVHKGNRTSFRKFMLGSQQAVLGLVHGPDMRNYDQNARQEFAHLLATEIRFVQSGQAHNRVILLGDFNMNPYDSGMNLATGLNAMMTRACTTSRQRTFMGAKYDFYYNPMWSLFGDGSDGPAGTVYDRSSQGPYGWNMVDQVVIHHSLVEDFEAVRIVTCAGSTTFTDANGRPDSNRASDHLPIEVKLKGSRYE